MADHVPTPERNGDIRQIGQHLCLSVRIAGQGLAWRRVLLSTPHPELFDGERWSEVQEGGRLGFLIATRERAEWQAMQQPWFTSAQA